MVGHLNVEVSQSSWVIPSRHHASLLKWSNDLDDSGVPMYQPLMWGLHQWGYPPKWIGYFMENPIKMDDLGYPHFRRPPYGKSQCSIGKRTTNFITDHFQ